MFICFVCTCENSDLCHLQHKLIGFYNRDEKCLLRGTDWVFKLSGLRLVFKGLTLEYYRQTQQNFNSIINKYYSYVSVLKDQHQTLKYRA